MKIIILLIIGIIAMTFIGVSNMNKGQRSIVCSPGGPKDINARPRFGTVKVKDKLDKPPFIKPKPVYDNGKRVPSENMETDSYTGNLIKEPMIIFMIIGVVAVIITYIVGALI